MAAPPHLLVPFQLDATGSAAVLGQDSTAELAQSLQVLLSTPTGVRVELPDYGVPDLTFRDPRGAGPVYAAAIARWEPRAAGAHVELTINADGRAVVTAALPATRGAR